MKISPQIVLKFAEKYALRKSIPQIFVAPDHKNTKFRKSQPLYAWRRARRHATINVVGFSDVTRCQNMVDVSDVTTCQNKHARVFCRCDVTEGRTKILGRHFMVVVA